MKKILIIDDSALMRRVLSDILNNSEELHAEWFAANGIEALQLLDTGIDVDAIILDINMPKMNGIEFLKQLRKRNKKYTILIVSTLAKDGGKETIAALELGAFDFVTKPGSLSDAKGPSFSSTLIWMLKTAMGMTTQEYGDLPIDETVSERNREVAKDNELHASVSNQTNMSKTSAVTITAGRNQTMLKADLSKHSKKPLPKGKKKLVALACSTGGPKALQSVIPLLPSNLDAAVLIVQHMPEGFTASLAKRLDELSSMEVKESVDGEAIKKGCIYVAKGGTQMRLIERNTNLHTLSVRVEPARNALKPCADIMYESLMESSFDEITCVVMTGMGSDATQGILQLEKTNNIYVIAQDEPSCTVYGMPKAIAMAGAVDEVVTLEKIAEAITKHVGVR